MDGLIRGKLMIILINDGRIKEVFECSYKLIDG